MKIHVNHVPEGGLKDRATYDPSTLDMDRDDLHLRKPFTADVSVNRVDTQLVVAVQIRCPVHLTCGRCLEEFTATLTPRGLFSYTVQPTDVVDITEDVRQEVILAYPLISLCAPECKGLCASCGTNLNRESCNHHNVEGSAHGSSNTETL